MAPLSTSAEARRVVARGINGLRGIFGLQKPYSKSRSPLLCPLKSLIEFGLTPQEEPLSVMDLENQVSRQRLTALTALRCCQRGNLWVSVFKDRTSTLSILEFHRKKNEA